MPYASKPAVSKRYRRASPRLCAVTLNVVPGFISVGSTVHVTLLGHHEALVEVILRRQFGGKVSETLAATIAADIAAKTSCRSDVTVESIPVLTHAGIPR